MHAIMDCGDGTSEPRVAEEAQVPSLQRTHPGSRALGSSSQRARAPSPRLWQGDTSDAPEHHHGHGHGWLWLLRLDVHEHICRVITHDALAGTRQGITTAAQGAMVAVGGWIQGCHEVLPAELHGSELDALQDTAKQFCERLNAATLICCMSSRPRSSCGQC